MISLRDVVTGFGNRDPLAEVWRRSLRGGGGGSAVITGVPPLRYIGDGRPLTDYTIYGDTVQDGTPTPENPVPVVGCGTDTAGEWTLPLTVNSTEYPIYLGTVPTTRRVKKLVLTGEEDARVYGYPALAFRINTSDAKLNYRYCACTHFPYQPTPLNSTRDGVTAGAGDRNLYFTFSSSSAAQLGIVAGDTNSFKSYLSQQYAAGTPVTVWYVLAEPETAVVNEPLMKIGEYADTVSAAQAGVTIPTVKGENILDVPTEVKPSQITIKGGISSV